ncbi:MAG: glycosyltransferase family 39 protein [Proteobacteria bacterium]|nr:glycosyltransferase family 39 protein [Pseudomonadota bacterium]
MAGSDDSPIDRHSWANAVTAGVFVVLAAVILLTFQDYGISWDEELHVPYGHKLLAYYTSGFNDRSAFSFINLYQYGGFFDLVSAIASNVSPFGEYETRHLLGGVFFLVGLFGAWKLTRLLAGARAALIAVICLASTPLLYGHSFINPKDAPLAWLGVWVAYFTCRVLGQERASWRTIAGLGVSLGLALGMRIIAFAFIGQMATVVAAKTLGLLLTDSTRAAVKKTLWTARPFVFALPIAIAVMGIVWPWSAQAPLNIVSVFTDSANLYWHPDMLWAGKIINSADLPPRYLAVLLAVQLPEYVLLGALLVALQVLARARSWRLSALAEPRVLQYLYVALTVVVPLAAFAVFRPSTYNGVRHFLFVVPQLVVLAAIGLDQTLGFLERRGRLLAAGFAGLLILGVVRDVIVMARVHPYQYLAFNSLTGGLKGAHDRFELDYWGVSYKEATGRLAQFLAHERAAGRPVPEKALLFVCGANTSAGYYLTDGIELTDDRTKADFFMGGDITNPRCRVRPEGPTVVEVKRMDAVLSYVLDLRGTRP